MKPSKHIPDMTDTGFDLPSKKRHDIALLRQRRLERFERFEKTQESWQDAISTKPQKRKEMEGPIEYPSTSRRKSQTDYDEDVDMTPLVMKKEYEYEKRLETIAKFFASVLTPKAIKLITKQASTDDTFKFMIRVQHEHNNQRSFTTDPGEAHDDALPDLSSFLLPKTLSSSEFDDLTDKMGEVQIDWKVERDIMLKSVDRLKAQVRQLKNKLSYEEAQLNPLKQKIQKAQEANRAFRHEVLRYNSTTTGLRNLCEAYIEFFQGGKLSKEREKELDKVIRLNQHFLDPHMADFEGGLE